MDGGLTDWGLGGISKCRSRSPHLPQWPSRYSLASKSCCCVRCWVFVSQCCDPDSANLCSIHPWVSGSPLETSQGHPVPELWVNPCAWLQSLQGRNRKRTDWSAASPEPVVTAGIFVLLLAGTACSAPYHPMMSLYLAGDEVVPGGSLCCAEDGCKADHGVPFSAVHSC